MVVATINRTLAALAIAIIGVEYVPGWVPKGTHHWRKVVKPGEMTAALGEEFESSAFMRVILREIPEITSQEFA